MDPPEPSIRDPGYRDPGILEPRAGALDLVIPGVRILRSRAMGSRGLGAWILDLLEPRSGNLDAGILGAWDSGTAHES